MARALKATVEEPKKSKRKKAITQSSASAIFAERSQRISNCGKWLVISPLELKSLIEQFNDGDFTKCGKTLVQIMNNDSQIKTCFEKRAGMLSSARWDIVAMEKATTEDAMAQIEVLRDFYSTLCVNSAEALDSVDGFNGLLRSMANAIVYGYDASAISFYNARTSSGRATYHANIMTNPIYFFDAQARKLRIKTSASDTVGSQLKGDWFIAHYKNPIAPALLTLHFFKAIAEVDWSSVCEKFGTPFIIVKTAATSGSTEWEQARDVASQIGANYNAVIGSDIEVITEKLAQGEAPHEKVIDYFDRSIARLVLGADLDTMSRDNAVGSEMQQQREDYLRQSDKLWAESVIDNYLTRPLLQRVFPGQKQLVYLSLSAQNERSISQIEQSVRVAISAGLPISKSWLYESLGIPVPTTTADSIDFGEPQTSTLHQNSQQIANSTNAITRLHNAQRKQFLPVLEQFKAIKNASTDKEAFLLATKLNQTFESLQKKVLANDEFAKVLAEEVLKTVENPTDKLKEQVKEELNVD